MSTIKEFQNELTKNMFGKSKDDCMSEKICVFCHKSITSFKDELSLKEFGISGMCQKCQDEIFTEPSEEEQKAEELADELTMKDNCIDFQELFDSF